MKHESLAKQLFGRVIINSCQFVKNVILYIVMDELTKR